MPSPVDAAIAVPAPRALAIWIPMKLVAIWPGVTTTVGSKFRSTLRTLQAHGIEGKRCAQHGSLEGNVCLTVKPKID